MTSEILTRRAFMAGAASLVPMASWASGGVLTDRIFGLTNDIRIDAGRYQLFENRRLARAAVDYAVVLAGSNEFSHSADGTRVSDRAARAGYRFRRVAENIAWVQMNGSDAEIAGRLMHGWMTSHGHRRNILDRHVSEMGIGAVRVGERVIAVQVFGARA